MPRQLPPAVLAATGGDPDAVRRHILDAAQRVIDTTGLATASVRAIATEAGVSGGTVYNYFDSHTRLLAQSIVHRAGTLASPAGDLPARAGTGSIEDNLGYFVRQAAEILDRLVPMLAATFSDAALLRALREEMAASPLPSDPARTVQKYLVAEQRLGRLSASADCRAAAALIVSMCHDDAFERFLAGTGGPARSRRGEIALVVRSLTT